MASRGLRDMDGGAEPLEDSAEREELRAQGATIRIKAVIVAAVATAASLVIS